MITHDGANSPSPSSRRGIVFTTLIRVVPLAGLLLLLIWLMIRYQALDTLDREVRNSLSSRTVLMADAVGHKLDILKSYTQGLSTNDLVTNSLIDPNTRDRVLPRFFQSLKIPNMERASVHLTDYKGRPIISSTGEKQNFQDSPFIRAAMEDRSLFRLDREQLAISHPVRYAGLPEGMLGFILKSKEFDHLFQLESRLLEYAIIKYQTPNRKTPDGGDILFSTQPGFVQDLDTQGDQVWHQSRQPIPGYPALWMISGIQAAKAFGPYRRMERFLVFAMVLDLIALTLGIFIAARVAGRPLENFVRVMDQAKVKGPHETRLPEEGPRELQALARSFNRLFQELDQARKEGLNKAMESGRAQLSAMVLHNIGNALTPLQVQVDPVHHRELEEIQTYLDRCYRELDSQGEGLGEYIIHNSRGKEVFAYMAELIHSLGQLGAKQDQAREKTANALEYVSEILSLQQSYAPSAQEKKERVDLNELVDIAVKVQTPAMDKRNIKLIRESCDPLPPLHLDKSRLLQIAMNLIKNAVEAVNPGPGEIRVTTFHSDGASGFEVRDTGQGFPPEKAETFFQFGASDKGASGMGLYYCKMYLETVNGRIELSSPGPGQGARVQVRLEPESSKENSP
ncbi:MAG: HAMP domain-containing histidine kinase [Desulfobacterales bacterium]|nr:HAMP domain-containing histidine kinase [Desulfobacterales bacterium]